MIMQTLRNPNLSIRALTSLVLGFFLCTFYAPTALAIKVGTEQEQRLKAQNNAKTDTQRYSQWLVEMKGQFLEAERLYTDQENSVIGKVTDVKGAIETGESLFKDDERWKKALQKALDLKTKADRVHANVVADFESDAELLRKAELPDSYLEEHKQDVTTFKDRYKQFDDQAQKVAKETDTDQKIAALRELNKLLGQWQFGRKHQYHDQEQLGNFTPKSAKDKPLMLSQADFLEAGLDSNPQVQLAALGDFDYSSLPDASNAAYLAETDEVVLTQAIKDKAEELEYHPIKIYNWVRNNIEWIPGWGAYQDAQLTLEAKRGNAMDISSLLIALLRASQIPARYKLGVAEIPADRYTNWLGNFANADVASDYAVMNGISTQVVTEGGKIARVRMQHIWVETAVDFYPSRGVDHQEADEWIQLDASFKQYDYQQGLDVAAIAGIDTDALANQFVNSGTVNETEGFVQNLDPTQLLATQDDAQQALQDHIDNNLNNPTVGDVIGGRTIKVFAPPRASAGLPFNPVGEATTFGKLPGMLQHYVGLGFGDDRQLFPMAKLNNQKITLSFKPATENDEQALAALLPEGEITDIDQLPTSISSSVKVIPELALNGVVFKTGDVMRIGHEIDMSYQVISPIARYAPYKYSVVAGSYLNIPIIGQVVSPKILQRLQAEVEQTRAIVESNSHALLASLNREDLFGNLFYAGVLAYFVHYIGLGQMLAKQGQDSHKFEIGYGSYGHEAEVNTFFGIPRGIKAGGVAFNIKVGKNIQSFDGEKTARNNLRFQTGILSSVLEHAVPEKMFNEINNLTEGVSAVKALQLAAQEGQRIYHINSSNLNSALSNLNLDSNTENELRNAVNQGRTVITHSSNIQVSGWSGAGYLIIDTEIMDGSYKISGGGNGGFLLGLMFANMLLLTIALAVATIGPIAIAGASLIIPTIIASALASIFVVSSTDGIPDAACFISGFLMVVGVVGTMGGFLQLGIGAFEAMLISAFATLGYIVEPPGLRSCLFGG